MPGNYNVIGSSNYVKFVRGTPTAFENLATKNADTLYFVSETNATSGKLYLGSKLISGSTDISSLGDIIISSLGDKDILVYDDTEQAWVNSDINSIIGVMTGATANANGASGLVPAPTAGNQDKFLKADGTWAIPIIPTDSSVFTTNQNSELTLVGFENAAVGSLLQIDQSGDVSWVNPSTLQTDLSSVNNSISLLTNRVGSLESTKVSREIVQSLQDIDPTAQGVESIVYMVPNGQSSGNLYDEYMVVNGAVELIGSSYNGDLSGYVTTTTFQTTVGSLDSRLTTVENGLTAIPNTYVTLTKYNSEVGNLNYLIKSQSNGDTLVDQVNDLTDRLTWYFIEQQQGT